MSVQCGAQRERAAARRSEPLDDVDIGRNPSTFAVFRPVVAISAGAYLVRRTRQLGRLLTVLAIGLLFMAAVLEVCAAPACWGFRTSAIRSM